MAEEESIQEMRRTLIYYTIKKYPHHASPHEIYKDIQDYQTMSDDKIREWYDKWFITKVKERNK